MKKITIAALLVVFLVPLTLSGQNAKVAVTKKNVVKLNLYPLFWKNINLGYERVLHPNHSVSLMGSFLIPTKIPGFNLRFFGQGEQLPGFDAAYNGWSLSPEYRYYASNNAPNGFYIGAYGRYQRLSSHAFLSVFDQNFNHIYYDAKIVYWTLGGGATMGAQFVIEDIFVIDWQFFGLGVGINRFKVDFYTNDPGLDLVSAAQDIAEATGEVPIIRNIVSVDAENDHLAVRAPWTFLSFKTGLSIGLAF